MNYLFRIIAVAALANACVYANDRGVDVMDKSNLSELKSDIQQIEYIVKQLKKCPSWIDVDEREVNLRNGITERYFNISAFETSTIRNAIEIYIQKLDSASESYSSEIAKIFALWRILFNVPEEIEVGKAKYYGSWGSPVEGKKLRLMWPYKVDDHGKYLLYGAFAMYHGAPYDAIKEFDYLSDSFGRRSLKK